MPKLEETLFGIAFLVFLHWPFTIPGSRYGIKGAVGGFLGTKPLICGGMKVQYDKDLKEYSDEYSDKCLLITPKKTEELIIMQSKRFNAASLVLKGSILWVTGGNDGTNTLSSSEFIEIEATTGPELPEAIEGHKMIDITDDMILITGGGYITETTLASSGESCGIFSVFAKGDGLCDDSVNTIACNYDDGDCCGPSIITINCDICKCHMDGEQTQIASTYYYHHDKTQHEKGTWSDGPAMQHKRQNHAVGIVIDKSTLEKIVFVTGGVGEEGPLKSTEKLTTSWSKGESLLMS